MSEEAHNPLGRVSGQWDAVLADMEATAEEYRDDNWEVVELHPGDSVAIADEVRYGIDLIVSSSEFEELAGWMDNEHAEFDSYEVFRAGNEDIIYLLLVIRDERAKRAICLPAYYDVRAGGDMISRAREEGVVYTHVRRLSTDRIITFTHEQAAMLLPQRD
ncbi:MULTISPECIES: hypothetical protein [unclassified Haladaptatus]|uniref:DUF7529 family protein n=1 Tax=unclassified Haladaptatus TaxID=2622732 RepID=UPI0023E7CA7C|nr:MULTISPECIES: hypothetical protein [unclassified Haladaptatus]